MQLLILLCVFAIFNRSKAGIFSTDKKNLTDIRKCRVTHTGSEYTGPIFKTVSGLRCQFWDTKYPVHEVSEDIQDDMFPDGSKSLAKNWCRNPGALRDEPWCYTIDKTTIDDYCEVPLCIYHECRLTGPGVEYAGKIKRSSGENECLSWKNRYKTKNAKEPSRFVNSAFPDGSRKKAKERCRNPDGDSGGPWCYVEPTQEEILEEEEEIAEERENRDENEEEGEEENGIGEDKDIVKKDYCDIPFCEEPDCMVYTTGYSDTMVHSHWTSLNNTYRNLSLVVKLWNPEEWYRNKLYLALSMIPVPSSGSQIQEWQAGIELMLSNRKSGIIAGVKDKKMVDSPRLITGTGWRTPILITWAAGYITISQEGIATPLLIQEYNDTGGLLGVDHGSFHYYSIMGEGGLWSFPFCDTGWMPLATEVVTFRITSSAVTLRFSHRVYVIDSDSGKITNVVLMNSIRIDCEMHTTSQLEFIRFWPMKKTTTTHDAVIFVRAMHSACLELRITPVVEYPSIRLMMGGKRNLTQVILHRKSNTKGIVIKQVKADNLLSYWEWKEFSISVFGNSFTVFWTRDIGTQVLIEVEHEVVRRLRWISPGSLSTAHWTISCAPTESEQVPIALPPECSISETEFKYTGSQWVTGTGKPCLPWIHKASVMRFLKNDALFEDGSVAEALNYCRNPSTDSKGPYCFVQDISTGKIELEYCYPRKCRATECRMAGTGNDYIGSLNTTRSNRVCQNWIENFPHKVDEKYKNDTLFTERSITKAKNYCRNPSRNIAGSWCYTADPAVPQDVCDVRDCVKPEECTMLTRGVGEGRLVYILHKWRKAGLKFWLKEWDPDLPDGIVFIIRPLKEDNYYKLVIGADDNEKVILYYSSGEDKKEIILKQKTLPHLIPIGKWGGFWLKVLQGQIILGYEGLDNYLFDWKHSNILLTEEQKHEIFKPMFITYTSVIGRTIGVNFPCDDCHTEKTTTSRFTKILSLGVWSKKPGSNYNNFTLYIRGTGVAVIPLLKLPGEGNYYALTIGDSGFGMYFIWQSGKTLKTITRTRINENMIKKDKWTIFTISYNETNLLVTRNGVKTLQWQQKEPMLFYWFSLGSEKGELTWSINCEPADIDSPSRNGQWSEWSPWTCSVTCGGGEGIQTRTCTDPPPNVLGEDCVGDDKLEGDCNNFKCGEISPDTIEYLQHFLQRDHNNLEVNQGNHVKLECDQYAIERILTEAPTAKINWALRGTYVRTDNERRVIVKNNSNIEINFVHPNDSGVYICMALQESGSRAIISVVSLAVKPSTPTIITRVSRQITLECQSEFLSYVYMDLTQRWEINGAIWKIYEYTTLAAVMTEEITYVNYTHAGEWKCVVTQPDLNFQWTTNWILVQVKHAPNILTQLMEDSTTAYLFGNFKNEKYVLLFLIGVLLLTIFLVAISVFVYLRWCQLSSR